MPEKWSPKDALVPLLLGCLAGDLLLPRCTDLPQRWTDTALELSVWGFLVAVLFALGRRLPRVALVGGMVVVGGVAATIPLLTLNGRGAALQLAITGLCGALALVTTGAGSRLGPSAAALSGFGAVTLSAVFTHLARVGTVPVGDGLHLLLGGVAALAAQRSPWLVLLLAPGALVPQLTSGPPSGGPSWRAIDPPEERPDLVLVTCDTLRSDAALTLDAFRGVSARGGHVFSGVAAASTWTLPTMASIMTGQPVTGHGAMRLPSKQKSGILDSVPTLAERLSAQGYHTAAIVAENDNTGPSFGFRRGFDWFDFNGSASQWAAVPTLTDQVARPVFVQVALALAMRSSSPVLRRALDVPGRLDDQNDLFRSHLLLASRPPGPMFLWVHLMDAHLPHQHAGDPDAGIDPRMARLATTSIADLRKNPGMQDPVWQAEMRKSYQNETRHVDRSLKALLEELGPTPSRGRVLVLTADHGEEFFDHGGFEHGHTFHQEVASVAVALEGVAVSTDRMAQIDLAPTLLRAAGLDTSDLPGHAVQDRRQPLVTVWSATNTLYGEARGGVRAAEWKLVLDRPEEPELYNLTTDPTELRNVANLHPDMVAWLLGQAEFEGATGSAVELDAATKAALEALGYVD